MLFKKSKHFPKVSKKLCYRLESRIYVFFFWFAWVYNVYTWSSACNSRVEDKLTTLHSHCPWSRNECEKGKEKKKANLIHSELSVVLEHFTTLISSRSSRCVSRSFRYKCFNIPSNTTWFLSQNMYMFLSQQTESRASVHCLKTM